MSSEVHRTKGLHLVDEPLVSVAELADRWGVDRHTVVRLLDAADVKPLFLSARARGSRRYVAQEVDEFLLKSRSS